MEEKNDKQMKTYEVSVRTDRQGSKVTDTFEVPIEKLREERIILELCVQEAIKLPKGQVPHLYDDYKAGFIKFDYDNCLITYSRGKINLATGELIFEGSSDTKSNI